MIRRSLSFSSREGIFHIEISSPAFGNKKEGQSGLLVSAISQVTLIQNNQSAKAAHFGVHTLNPFNIHVNISCGLIHMW